MTSLEGRFALAHDTTSVRVRDLPEQLRVATTTPDGDFIWTQRRSRTSSLILGADAAALLESFRHPLGIAEAVLQFGIARKLDPTRVLYEAYPLIREAVERGLLVPETDWEASRVDPTLAVGDRIGNWTVRRCLQSLDDGEVYEVSQSTGARGAVKLARGDVAMRRLAYEARILERLHGAVAPRLLECAPESDPPYIALEWCDGQSPDLIAEQLRAGGLAARPMLRQLGISILEAYTRLHAQGVLHGDVHPLNLVVGARGSVTLLDFGCAQAAGEPPGESRGFVPYYLEPETALAMVEGTPPPAFTALGEQYGVAALLFELMSGHRYLDFHLERDRFLHQICVEQPRSFAACGVHEWPELEAILARALAREPADRFGSLDQLLKEFTQVGTDVRPARGARKHRRWLARRLAEFAPGGLELQRALRQAPRSSVYFGLAGPALMHLRLSQLRADPRHLAAADCWCSHAEYLTSDPEAYVSAEMKAGMEPVSPAALLHGPAGVALTRAAIAHERCDDAEVQRATRWFLRETSARCPVPDLTLGRAGVLLGAAVLSGFSSLQATDREAVLRLGRRTLNSLVRRGRAAHGPADPDAWQNLGLAHGWAGVLFAMLRWCDADPGTAVPDQVPGWLDELARRGQRAGGGLRWPWLQGHDGRLVDVGYMPGWCNGTAGFVTLWSAAYRSLARKEDLERVAASARDVWASDGGGWTLCCGATGCAFALLRAAEITGEGRWLARARMLADRAVRTRLADSSDPAHAHSLFRGDAGLALLLAELDRPALARFPMLEGVVT